MSAEQIRARFIETGGHVTQSIGIGRVIGQIFAHVYLSPEPQTLDDMVAALGISKGSASMSVRQLLQWGALQPVWIKGERKDYFEASEDFPQLVRSALLDLIGRRMQVADNLLIDTEHWLAESGNGAGSDDLKFINRRVKKLRVFRDRAQAIWDHSLVRLLRKS
jgi:HTH-type transcriptional regulator, glycine betaine synthesis regulator